MAKVREGAGLPEGLEGEVEASESSARHLVHLSRVMIDINQLESGSMPVVREPLSLRQLAAQASELLGSPSHLQNAIPETCDAYCDSHLTARVLSHLIDNAFRHNPDERRAATVTAHIEGEKVAVCVSDNGRGFRRSVANVSLNLSGTFRPRTVNHPKPPARPVLVSHSVRPPSRRRVARSG